MVSRFSRKCAWPTARMRARAAAAVRMKVVVWRARGSKQRATPRAAASDMTSAKKSRVRAKASVGLWPGSSPRAGGGPDTMMSPPSAQPGAPENPPESPGGGQDAGRVAHEPARRNEFLHEDKGRDGRDPEEVHDAGDEQERHEHPAAAEAEAPVRYTQASSVIPATPAPTRARSLRTM